jgi:hypothetical protein
MKVLLRKTNDKLYYVGFNQWAADARYARDFKGVEQALELQRDEKLAAMEVVLSYDDPAYELVLPMQDGAR